MKADLDAGQPFIYYGDNGTSGHAWICDGYQGTDMFHMNWGWSGSYNGYFNIDDITVGGSGFSPELNQAAVFGIKPDPSQYPYFCSGQTNVTSYIFGTIEDGSGPVADYQNNVNCRWLITPGDSTEKVNLHFTRFNTNLSDEVKVFDGSATDDSLLGSFSGSSLPSDVLSTGPEMLVTFTSGDGIPSDGWMAIFEAKYHNPGINEQTINDLEVYPVPASDVLNIHFNPRHIQSFQMDIVSVEGEIVLTETVNNLSGKYERTINLSHLAKGIYFLRIKTDTSLSVTKIIVQ
jgi:hypothetical protein